MNQPTENEINIKLSEFMGEKLNIPVNIDELSERQKKLYLPYTTSLDAQLTIIEKLNLFCNFDICRSLIDKRWRFSLTSFTGTKRIDAWGRTVQHAAALATYKAVIELEGEEK